LEVPKKTLVGQLITLRAIDVQGDAAEWFEAMQEPELHLWTGNNIPKDVDEVRDIVLTTYATHPKIISWGIRESKTERMVGIYWIGVPFLSEDHKLITFDAQRIAKPYWRKGHTKGARSLVYRYVFLELGVEVIHAQAWKPNINSCMSMENPGFELVRVRPHFNPKYRREIMQRDYVLRKEKWMQLNTHLT